MNYSENIAEMVEKMGLVLVEYRVEDFFGVTDATVTEEGEVWISDHWADEDEKADFVYEMHVGEN